MILYNSNFSIQQLSKAKFPFYQLFERLFENDENSISFEKYQGEYELYPTNINFNSVYVT